MNEVKMRRMKSDASDSPLKCFLAAVLSIAHHRVADCRKLHPDLVLQPRHQRYADERCVAKRSLDAIAKFSSSCSRIAFLGQPLKHALASKVVNQCRFVYAEMSANDGKILPHRPMAEKLSNQRVAVVFGFCEEQNAGDIAIDTMDNEGSLPFRLQFCGKKGKSRAGVGAFDRHSQKAGRLIKSDYRIVFVEDGKLTRKTRLSVMMPPHMLKILAPTFLHSLFIA